MSRREAPRRRLHDGHWEFTYGPRRAGHPEVQGSCSRRTSSTGPISTTRWHSMPRRAACRSRSSRSRRYRSPSSARPFRTRRSPTRALRAGLDLRHPGRRLQKMVDECARKGAEAVVLLSHNGMDVDLKLAGARARHRRDPRRPHARRRAAADRRGQRRRQDAGHQCRLERQVPRACSTSTWQRARSRDFRYRLLPVFSNLLAAGPGDGGAHRAACARPTRRSSREARDHGRPALPPRQLQRHLRPADPATRCCRRKDAEIAFSPGFRWGTTLLPGEAITLDTDGPDRDHLSADHGQRADRRARSRTILEDIATTCSTPIPTSSRAATWCASAA